MTKELFKKIIFKFYHYSGIRFISEMINPPSNAEMNKSEYRKPSNFIPWIFSIYIIIFGIASSRYEGDINSYKMLISTFQSHMGANNITDVCAELAPLQKVKVSVEPDFIYFWETISSFYKNEPYEIGKQVLIQTVSTHNKNLQNATLYMADLREANLYEADLREANLREADLRGVDFYNAKLDKTDFSKAKLLNAKFGEANLRSAKFQNATLHNAMFISADLQSTYFNGADLYNATFKCAKHLRAGQLNTAKTLYKVTLPEKLEDRETLNSTLFEKPDWLEEALKADKE
ncbi:Pentapeptide repeat-containing protein [Maridesulfovibrio ferrireducens]|uniref:Pentapeptide repeat-containing protein n=1 Tax=Maridesulfovibrio ferrireducens TaxID=246191 RepID=A0A1G9HVQ4_9BACT|nr:pentapeptide repeat-containing protein [Maridesulfovibrio ferrireducens]SDL16896.1 Pentapeptide repeat-containing protein [Maridesulfovibrio ferrireducens]